jgi:hypothetical protein
MLLFDKEPFLSTEQLQSGLGFERFFRFSLAHYNTVHEVEFMMDFLEEMSVGDHVGLFAASVAN